MHQVGLHPQVPGIVKLANASRLLQYLAKLIVYLLMLYRGFDALEAFGAFSLVLFVFLGYQFWRLIPLYKRINKFVLQWALPLCDIAIVVFVKIVYICTYQSYQDSTYTYFIPFFLLIYAYLAYVIVLLVLFASWLTAWKLAESNNQNQQNPSYVSFQQNQVTTSSLARKNPCYLCLLYFNYVCMLVLIVGYFAAVYFYYTEWPYPDTFIYLKISLWLEGGDFILNLGEDTINSYNQKLTLNAHLISEAALPGLSCCSFSETQDDQVVIQGYNQNIH